MYLICCSLAFLALSIPRSDRSTWLALAVLSILLLVNKSVFSVEGDLLYVVRAAMTLIVGVFIVYQGTIVALYQAFILTLILLAYAALAFDVSQGQHVLIYNNYENVIYGLVACQFIGATTKIRAGYNYTRSGFNFVIPSFFGAKKI